MSTTSALYASPHFGLQGGKVTQALKKSNPLPAKTPSEQDVFETNQLDTPLKHAANVFRQIRELLNGIQADLAAGKPTLMRSEGQQGMEKIHFKVNNKAYTVRKLGDNHYEFKKKVTRYFAPANQFRFEMAEHKGKTSFYVKSGVVTTMLLNCESKALAESVKTVGEKVFTDLKGSIPDSIKSAADKAPEKVSEKADEKLLKSRL